MSTHESITELSQERYLRKLEVLFSFADGLRSLSTDPQVQFGCIIFPVDCTSVDAIGYNGMPRGVNTLPRTVLDTPDGSGYCHAEMNALCKWTRKPNSVLFVHGTPCMRCAGQIINAEEIQYVVCETKNPYSQRAFEFLKEYKTVIDRQDKDSLLRLWHTWKGLSL